MATGAIQTTSGQTMATVPIRISDHRRPPRHRPRSEPVRGQRITDQRSGRSIPAIIAATGDNSPIMEKRSQGFRQSAAGSPARQRSGQQSQNAIRPPTRTRYPIRSESPPVKRPAVRSWRPLRSGQRPAIRQIRKQPRNGKNFISGNYPGILIETGENDTKQEK